MLKDIREQNNYESESYGKFDSPNFTVKNPNLLNIKDLD